MKFLKQLTKIALLKAVFVISTTVALSLSVSSCKDNDDKYMQPELVINTQLENDMISFTKDGGAQDISMTTNRKWTVVSSEDWIAVNPASGNAGDVKITIKVLPNTGLARKGSITINLGLTKKTITINQNGEGGSADVVIFNEDFNKGLGCWTTKLISTGANNWRTGEYKGDGYVEISAYKSKTDENKALLISPMIDFKTITILSFQYKQHHAVAGTKLKVVLLNKDQEIIGDALETIDPSEPAGGYAKQYTDVTVNIPLNIDAKYIAIYYDADKTHTTGFQIDNIKLLGGEGSVPVNCGGSTPTPTPTPGNMSVVIFDQSFSESMDCWTNKKEVTTGVEWKLDKYTDKKTKEVKDSYIKISAFDYKTKKGIETKTFLVSPMVDFKTATKFSFKYKAYYAKEGTTLKVVLLDASKNIIGNALETINPKEPVTGFAKDYTNVEIDVALNASAKYIALYYEGDLDHTTGFQVKDVKLVGESGSTPVNCNGGGTTPTPDPAPNPTPTPTPAPSNGGELFINNYVSGSSSNKYISIYNPTDKEIDLSSYSIRMTRFNNKNLNPTPFKSELSGKIGSHETIVFSNGRGEVYKGTTVALKSVIEFSGNDPVALFKGDDMIDVLGEFDKPWLINGKDAGKHKSFHRKASVDKPSVTFDISEWEELNDDDVSFLGKR